MPSFCVQHYRVWLVGTCNYGTVSYLHSTEINATWGPWAGLLFQKCRGKVTSLPVLYCTVFYVPRDGHVSNEMEGPYILACRYTLYNITLNSTLSHLNTSATEEGVIKLPRLSKRSVLLVEDWCTIVLQGIVMYILGSPWFESWPFLAILADDTH